MTISIDTAHVYLILVCDECGEEWGVEDYDSLSVEQAEQRALEKEKCPHCEEASKG